MSNYKLKNTDGIVFDTNGRGIGLPTIDNISNAVTSGIATGSLLYAVAQGSIYFFNGTSWVTGTGSSGTSGASSTSGSSGTAGSSGSTGTSGSSGSTGTSGSSGSSGTRGSSGSSGSTGSSGSSGSTGSSGSSGSSGSTGTSGSAGTAGSSGSTGSSGSSGVSLVYKGTYNAATTYSANDVVSYNNSSYVSLLNSNVGNTPNSSPSQWAVLALAGTNGSSGSTGTSGSSGTSGAAGAAGSSGTSGNTGAAGSSGTSGNTGAAGSSGTSGNTGAAGSSGTSGNTGAAGSSGTSGSSGTRGSSGTSGNTGAAGSSGTSGNTGAAGSSGTSGNTGAAGSSGTSGNTGAAGSSGTSGTSFANDGTYYRKNTVMEGDGVQLYIRPATSGSYTLIKMESKVNQGSDMGFILVQDESANAGGSGSEDLRMTLGVYNDFRQSSAHSDELWIQGGGRLVYNVGTWDSELNTIIGTPGGGTTGGFEWRVNNSASMYFTHSGQLGIGMSPSYRLDVSSDIRISTGLTISPVNSSLYATDGTLSYYSTTNGVYLNGAGSGGWLRLNGSGVENFQNCIDIYGSGGSRIEFRTSNSERARITTGGNLLIGSTTAPTTGGFTNTRVLIKQIADGGSGGGMHIEASGSDNVAFFAFDGSVFRIGTSYRTTGAYQPIVISTQGSDRLRVNNDGSVGIGASGSMRLHVADVGANISGGNAISTSTMKGIRLENTNNNNESIGIWFNTGGSHWSGISGQRNDYTSTWGTDLRFYTHENGFNDLTYARQRMIITSEGAMGLGVTPTNTGGRFEASNDVIAYSSSDIRFKDNVVAINNPLEKISKIRGVYFDWIEMEKFHGNKGHDIGIIAQEVEEVLPEIVTTRESGYKAVKYERLTPLLIEAIKELSAENESLKKRLESLENSIYK